MNPPPVKTLKSRIVNVVGGLFAIAVLGLAGFGVVMATYWDPRHRPVVVLGGTTDAPWTVRVDGADAKCARVGPVKGEPASVCELVLPVGDHELSVRGGSGKDIFHATATVTKGDDKYLWAPELPSGMCLFRETAHYQEVVIPFGSGPRSERIEPGFRNVGDIDYWFTSAPGRIQSQEKNATRLGMRLASCENGPS